MEEEEDNSGSDDDDIAIDDDGEEDEVADDDEDEIDDSDDDDHESVPVPTKQEREQVVTKRRKFGKSIVSQTTKASDIGQLDKKALKNLLSKLKTEKAVGEMHQTLDKEKKKAKSGKVKKSRSDKRVSFELSRNEVKVFDARVAPATETNGKARDYNPNRKLKNPHMKPKKSKNKMRARLQKRQNSKRR